MPKNRDYTGLVHTPSSMAWLILQRSIAKGEIDKLKKMLDEAPARIARYEAELRAIDAVIPLHEVAVDPSAIVGTRPRAGNALPWGQMTRHILNLLRDRAHPLYTDEIALHVARVSKIDLESFTRTKWNTLIRYRLKGLVDAGSLNRHPSLKGGRFSRWSLAELLDD